MSRSRKLILMAIVTLLQPAPVAGQEHPARYTSEQLLGDFDVFRAAMEEAHGGLHAFRSPGEVSAAFDREAAGLANADSEWALFRAVARVVSEVQDGHTLTLLSDAAVEWLDAQPSYLPFALKMVAGKPFILDSYTRAGDSLRGAEIVSIGDRSWSQILDAMLEHLPSDGVSRNGELFLLQNPVTFGQLYQVLFGSTNSYALGVVRDDARQTVEIAGVERDVIDAHYVRLIDEPLTDRFRLTFPDAAPSTAVLRIGLFYGDGYDEFLDDAFRQMAVRGTRNLVIDLRGNVGGVEAMGERLVAHLTSQPFDFYERATVKRRDFPSLRFSNRASWSYSDDMATVGADGELTLTESYRDFLGVQQPVAPHFDGPVYVLIDGGSFSTTTDTTTRLHQMKRATFVGVEAGGNYYGNTSGATAVLTLPHTRLRVRVPLERFYNHAESDVPFNRSLAPDLVVDSPIAYVLEGGDAVLETAFELISDAAAAGHDGSASGESAGAEEPDHSQTGAQETAAQVGTDIDLAALPTERRFDFMFGDWDILVDGERTGRSTIRPILEGSAIEQEEVYFSNGTGSKALLSYAHREQQLWIQSWVDIWGYHIVSKGGLEDDRMVLYTTTGYYEDSAQAQVLARQIYRPIGTDQIDYTWEITQDGGQTWTPNNSARYERRPAGAR